MVQTTWLHHLSTNQVVYLTFELSTSCRTFHNYRKLKLQETQQYYRVLQYSEVKNNMQGALSQTQKQLRTTQFDKSKASIESLVGENSKCYRKLRASNKDYTLSKLRSIDKSSIMQQSGVNDNTDICSEVKPSRQVPTGIGQTNQRRTFLKDSFSLKRQVASIFLYAIIDKR